MLLLIRFFSTTTCFQFSALPRLSCFSFHFIVFSFSWASRLSIGTVVALVPTAIDNALLFWWLTGLKEIFLDFSSTCSIPHMHAFLAGRSSGRVGGLLMAVRASRIVLTSWCNAYHLSISLDKSTAIDFFSHQPLDSMVTLRGSKLEWSPVVRILWIWFGRSLLFNYHFFLSSCQDL